MNPFFVMALAATNPDGFFGGIKGVATSWLNSFLDVLLVPIGLIICGIFFIFNLLKAISDYQDNHGDQIKGKIIFMVIIVIIAALLATKSTWWGFVFGG